MWAIPIGSGSKMTFSSKMVNDFANTFINKFYGFVLNGFIDLKVTSK